MAASVSQSARVVLTAVVTKGVEVAGRRTGSSASARLDAGVPPELTALPASLFELVTRRSAVFVDAASVRAERRSEVHARALWRVRKGALSEVPIDQLTEDVVSLEATPSK